MSEEPDRMKELPRNYEEVVGEISALTGLREDIVRDRVWREALDAGSNTRDEARKSGVTSHVYNASMEKFYRQTDSFIFETMVEFCRPGKRSMAESVKERIGAYIKGRPPDDGEINILMLGDGAGSDTIYMHKCFKGAAHIYYYDLPDSMTSEFALKRFGKYGIDATVLADYGKIPVNFFDAVVSIEVLEHLGDPKGAIRDIASFLKAGGIALISESFGLVNDNYPTHLTANRYLEARTPFLCLGNNLVLSYYNKSVLFKPMEFIKKERAGFGDRMKILGDRRIAESLIKSLIRKARRV